MRRSASFIALALCASIATAPVTTARADDEVHLRGNYWRDRNTRVIAPEVSLRKDYSTGTTVEASYLLDAITSASISAGVTTDQPFTELRNEVGAHIGQRLGPVTLGLLYRYSTESDYWAHTVGVNAGVDLFQKNLSLAASYVYGHSEAAQRASAVGYLWAAIDRKRDDSQLNSHFFIFSATQLLARWASVEGAYELSVLDGYQANPYRTTIVGGAPLREVVPNARMRHSVTGALRLTPYYNASRAFHYLSLYLKYRLYHDSWGVTGHAPEVRAYAGLGPVELRFTTRYYTQGQSDFWRSHRTSGTVDGETVDYDMPFYDMSVNYANCPMDTGCYTGDAKLGAFQSVFLEGRVDLALRFFGRYHTNFAQWLARSRAAVSAGYYINKIPGHYTPGDSSGATELPFVYAQYGNAWVGGVELVFPL